MFFFDGSVEFIEALHCAVLLLNHPNVLHSHLSLDCLTSSRSTYRINVPLMCSTCLLIPNVVRPYPFAFSFLPLLELCLFVISAVSILIYNSILKWQHSILKSGASTPRTVTKFAVKTAIDLTSTIYGWNFNFRSIRIVFWANFFDRRCGASGLGP